MITAADILRLPPLNREPTEFLVLVIPLCEENVLRMFTRQRPRCEKRWIGRFELGLMKPPFSILEER